MPAIGEEIECLGLDKRRFYVEPFEVLLLQLSVSRIAFALSNGLNGGRAVLRLLSAGDVGQPGKTAVRRWLKQTYAPRAPEGECTCGNVVVGTCTDCCLK